MRLKWFTYSLVETDLKMAEKFVMGLDLKTRHMVEVIDHTTYEDT